uniref:BTB domain-containing protein n=1 Tax=Anopheles dirus TaxID=7168 RepID=A0A182N7R5_9DIPT
DPARSDYFRALLYGGLKASNQKEVRLSVPLEPFKYLLKYMYSGKLSLNHINNMSYLGKDAKNKRCTDEVKHMELLSLSLSTLCMSPLNADVTFIVNGDRIPAHRAILAARSESFSVLINNELKTSKDNEIKIEAPVKPFKYLLKYIYSGNMSLKQMGQDDFQGILDLATMYGFKDLIAAISGHLSETIRLGNVCATLEMARLFEMDELCTACELFIDHNATDVLRDKSFRKLSFITLSLLLDRDSIAAQEVDIFRAVYDWYQHSAHGFQYGPFIFEKVRFTLMSRDELQRVVQPTKVLDKGRLRDVMAEKKNASASCRTKFLEELPSRVINKNTNNIRMQNPSKDEIVHTDVLAAQMVKMYMNGDYADVLFVVENERIPAHRMFLAARSDYFRALLYGGLKESNQKEVKLSVRLKPFKYLLKYMYSGKLSLNHIKLEDILDTLGLTDVFNLSVLKTAISEYLCKVISLSNVCTVLNSAQIYALSGLISQCHSFMDVNATQVLKQETFRNISYQALISVLDRKSFSAYEIEIFQAVHNWCGLNKENADKIKNLYAKVRFTAMSQKELLTVVRGTNVLKPSELLDIITQKDSTDHLPFRGVVECVQARNVEFGNVAC